MLKNEIQEQKPEEKEVKDKKSQYPVVTQEQLDKKIAENKSEDKSKKLKIDPHRRTKGEGIEKKGGGYRGDTRITAKLKKAGFTESRLAKLRKDHAEWKAKRKKKKNKKS